MPPRLNIREVKRAGLCDHPGVDVANDLKSLRRGQSSSGGKVIVSVDRHSDKSGFFLDDHVPAVDTNAATRVMTLQDERSANVWMARERHLGARRKNAHPSRVS